MGKDFKIEQIISNNGKIKYRFHADYYGTGDDIISAMIDSGICKSEKRAIKIAKKAGWPEQIIKRKH